MSLEHNKPPRLSKESQPSPERQKVPKQVATRESKAMPGELEVFALEEVAGGEYIFSIHGQVVDERTKFTIQVDTDTHLNPIKEDGTPETGMYVNHSCDPNAKIVIVKEEDQTYIEVHAREQRDIKKGEQITFDYATFEDEMTIEGIGCLCGLPNCRGTITGFNHLPEPVKQRYTEEGIAPKFLSPKNQQ